MVARTWWPSYCCKSKYFAMYFVFVNIETKKVPQYYVNIESSETFSKSVVYPASLY